MSVLWFFQMLSVLHFCHTLTPSEPRPLFVADYPLDAEPGFFLRPTTPSVQGFEHYCEPSKKKKKKIIIIHHYSVNIIIAHISCLRKVNCKNLHPVYKFHTVIVFEASASRWQHLFHLSLPHPASSHSICCTRWDWLSPCCSVFEFHWKGAAFLSILRDIYSL